MTRLAEPGERWTALLGHVERPRRAGCRDEDVLAIREATAYYACVNRIADGLAVALEGEGA